MLDIDKLRSMKRGGRRLTVPRKTNMATRHHHAARTAQATEPDRQWYEILDPAHRPDLNGHLGGVQVHRRGGGQHVLMSEAQARFFLDSGAIRLIENPQDTQAAANADRRPRR